MKIVEISEAEYKRFVDGHRLSTFYQSLEWYHLKKDEGKVCELLGLYENNILVGASIVLYLRVLKVGTYAYASRGFLYSYKKVDKFTDALREYFSKKNVIFFRMDPPVELCRYDSELNKTKMKSSPNLITKLRNNGFNYFGNGINVSLSQFKFVYKIDVLDSYDEHLKNMSKSTIKNINLAYNKGVRVRVAKGSELSEVYRLIQMSVQNKEIKGYPIEFYSSLIKNFKDDVMLYITYIDRDIYVENLKKELNDNQEKLIKLHNQMEKVNVGKKLLNEESILESKISKTKDELKIAKKMHKKTNIASMVVIKKYDEVVAFASGMDNEYRKFCPKYAMYPELIKYAIENKYKCVNLLGVQNIFDPKDKDYGVYEVKKGFGGYTEEYIGQFDLPMNIIFYNFYLLARRG